MSQLPTFPGLDFMPEMLQHGPTELAHGAEGSLLPKLSDAILMVAVMEEPSGDT